MMRSTVYRNVNQATSSKLSLIKKKTEHGVPMEWFYKTGNGIRTLLDKTGRLTDLKGVFLISAMDNTPLLAKSSDQVIRDIQKLIRCDRKKDELELLKVANFFGYSSPQAGQQYLRSMKVTWLEVTGELERLSLCRSLNNHLLLL